MKLLINIADTVTTNNKNIPADGIRPKPCLHIPRNIRNKNDDNRSSVHAISSVRLC